MFFPLFLMSYSKYFYNTIDSMQKITSVLTFLLLLLPRILQAYDNDTAVNSHHIYATTIKQVFGTFYIRETIGIGWPLNQLGIYIERRAYNKLHLGIGYSQWEAVNLLYSAEHIAIEEEKIEIGKYIPVIGKLEYRSQYKMLDLYVFYKHKFSTHHYLNIGIGPSYCWGLNGYLKSYVRASPTDVIVQYDTRQVEYWGLIPVISYDYILLKNRLNFGVDLRARYYANRPKSQYDDGVHIGVNL